MITSQYPIPNTSNHDNISGYYVSMTASPEQLEPKNIYEPQTMPPHFLYSWNVTPVRSKCQTVITLSHIAHTSNHDNAPEQDILTLMNTQSCKYKDCQITHLSQLPRCEYGIIPLSLYSRLYTAHNGPYLGAKTILIENPHYIETEDSKQLPWIYYISNVFFSCSVSLKNVFVINLRAAIKMINVIQIQLRVLVYLYNLLAVIYDKISKREGSTT